MVNNINENMNILDINGIKCYEKDGTAYLDLEAVARGLGFTQTAASGNEVVRWERVNKYLKELSVPTSGDGFIPENIFYRLAMRAKNATAEAFQAKVADEIIPAIRKTGGYVANDDAFLQAYLPFSDEQTKIMFKAQLMAISDLNNKIKNQEKIIALQKEENDLLTNDALTWADRNFINFLIRQYAYYVCYNNFGTAWNKFKKELMYKHGISLNTRISKYQVSNGKKPKTLDMLTDNEVVDAVKIIVAMCRDANIPVDEFIEKHKRNANYAA